MKYKTIKQVRVEMMALRGKGKNWAQVGEVWRITGGTAHRIAVQNYEPKVPELRAKLGLSSMELAATCAVCGEVHITRSCTKGRKVHSEKWERIPGHAGSKRVK